MPFMALFVSPTALAAKKQIPTDRLVNLWLQVNGECRGGRPDDPRTDAACEVREVYDKKLEARGWCYGEPGQYGSQMVWHECGSGSSHPAFLVTPKIPAQLRPVVLSCSGKTVVFGENAVVKSSRTWDSETLTIDQSNMSVVHNDEPESATLTRVTSAHYMWHQDATLITDGSFNRINGTGEERMTMHVPGFLAINYYEHCATAPKPRF